MCIDRSNFQGAGNAQVQETDNLAYGEWWAWTQVISEAIRRGSNRLAMGIVTAGFAVGTAVLFQSERGTAYGPVMLWVSLGLALWLVLSAAVSGLRGR